MSVLLLFFCTLIILQINDLCNHKPKFSFYFLIIPTRNNYTYTSNSGENIYTWAVAEAADNESGYSGAGDRSMSGSSTANVGFTLAYNGTDTILTFDVNTTSTTNIVDKFVLKNKEIDLSGLEITSNPKVGAMSVTIAPIPEPTTATLSLLALAGLAARRRRR